MPALITDLYKLSIILLAALFEPDVSNFNQLLQKSGLFSTKELNFVQINVSKEGEPIILSFQKKGFSIIK